MTPSNPVRVTRDKEHLHLQLRHDLAPIAHVAVGDTLLVETEDNFALYREMTSDNDLVPEPPPLKELNPLTGPIAVAGISLFIALRSTFIGAVTQFDEVIIR